MKPLRIFVDLGLPADVLELLQTRTKGHQLIFPLRPTSSVLSKSGKDPQFATADVAFGQPDPGAIEEAQNLKWVHVSSSGITRYDNAPFRDSMAARRIPLTNSATVYHEACAVHALSFILGEARRLPQALKVRTASGTDEWNALRAASRTLRGETALILGYGAIGRRLSELLEPFHMNVLAYRRNPRGDETLRVISGEALMSELPAVDHLINILPDSSETRHFLNGSRLAELKPGAVLYNIGRGTTVDQGALLNALRSGKLRSAWLDVTDPEPLPEGHPLLNELNCHITPHIAGGQPEEAKALVLHFLHNLDRFVRGETLIDRVM